jgi:hypothetical protein
MTEAIEWTAKRQLKKTFKKNLRLQPGMIKAINTLLNHSRIAIEDPSVFIRIAVRREVRAQKVGQYKNKRRVSKEKSTVELSIRSWEMHFPSSAKVIKAIVWARIKEENKKLGIKE